MTNNASFTTKSIKSRLALAWALALVCALSFAASCAFARPALAQDSSGGGGYANFIIEGITDDGFAEPGTPLVISIDKFCEGSSIFGPAAAEEKLMVAIQPISPSSIALPESFGPFGTGPPIRYTVPSETLYLTLRIFFETSESSTISVEYKIPCVDLTCGDSAQWDFDPLYGTLAISGSGAMRDYENAEGAPWYSFRESVKGLSIADGITSVGSYAFYGMANLPEVTFPTSVREIGAHAFQGCGFGLADDFSYVNLPESIGRIHEYAFADCSYLYYVFFENAEVTVEDHAFDNCCTAYPEEDNAALMFAGYASHDGNVARYARKNHVLFYAVNGDLGSYVLNLSGSGAAFKEEVDDEALNALFSTLFASGVAQYGADPSDLDGDGETDSYSEWIDLNGDGSPDISMTYEEERGIVLKKTDDCNLSGSITIELSEEDCLQAAMNNPGLPNGFYYGKLIVRFTIIPITNAKVSVAPCTYSGKPQKPAVTVKLGSETLVAGVDYTVAYSNNVNAGKAAKATVTGIGAYNGTAVQTFAIAKAKNTFKAKLVKKTRTVSSSEKTVIKAKKAFKVTKNKSKGKVAYKKLSGSSKISVSKNGKITVKKGLKKGTYKVKVKLTCAATSNYEKATKTLTLKVKAR